MLIYVSWIKLIRGEELKTNATINVGITARVGILGASAKEIVKTAAKNKIVKELGEELAEQLLKNTDDATNITKYLKNLKKAGLSQSAIKQMAETSGEEGLKWLEKQTKKDISKEILEKIVKNADDYAKYSDELMDIIGLYEGRTDDIIEYVNKNGDDGVEEICERFKSGSYTIKDGTSSGYNPLEDIVYTDKVKEQMMLGDYHSFPEAVEGFGDMGKVSSIVGGDGVTRTLVEIEGSFMGKDGVFQYIIEPDGVTCNHRLFVPN